MSRDLLLFLRDIENACRKIIRFTDGRARDEVLADEMRFDALLHNLQVIGEAVKGLPEPFRDGHPDLPWREIAGMRDVVAHAYFALDLDILWDAVRNDVPALLMRVQQMVRDEERAQPAEPE